jgi:hypothetical protein
MSPEMKENFEEKLRLANVEITKTLDKQIGAMLAEHSRDGMLGSGNTIGKTMDLIEMGSSKLYQTVLDHLCILTIGYSPMLETEIRAVAKSAHDSYKEVALDRLNKSTVVARAPQLYERMLPDVKSGFATDMANFHNSLNVAILEIKQKATMPISTKILWSIEAFLILASMFIAGMWYQDPGGNYEPIVVGLALVIPLLAVMAKFRAKKT